MNRIIFILLGFSFYNFSIINSAEKVTGKKRKDISNQEKEIAQERVRKLVEQHGSKGAFLHVVCKPAERMSPAEISDVDLVLSSIPHKETTDINYQAPFGKTTILMEAVLHGNKGFAEKLLKKEANPNIKDSLGNNTIYHALKHKKWPNTVPLLLMWGANLKGLTFNFDTQSDRENFEKLIKEHLTTYRVLLNDALEKNTPFESDVKTIVMDYVEEPASYEQDMHLGVMIQYKSVTLPFAKGYGSDNYWNRKW